MTKIQNIIFDFDGTLVDTAPLILSTMQATIREMGLPDRNEAQCRATIGLRLEEIPAVLWTDMPGIAEKYARTYRRIFDELKRPLSIVCYPDVVATLRKFKESGFRMAIASSRSRKSLEEYVELFDLTGCFDMLVGGNDVVHGKPAPDPVLAILNARQWQAADTLTVGDAPVDIMMGKAAGTLTCAVTYGNSTLDALAASHPDFIISTFRELQPLLKAIS